MDQTAVALSDEDQPRIKMARPQQVAAVVGVVASQNPVAAKVKQTLGHGWGLLVVEEVSVVRQANEVIVVITQLRRV